IHLDVHEQVVHERRGLRILERLVRHHMTPVARGVSDAQENRPAFTPRTAERLRSPGIPVDWIVGVLPQIRTCLARQPVHAIDLPLHCRAIRSLTAIRPDAPYNPTMSSNVVVSKRRDPGRLVAIVVTLVVLAAWPLALSPLIDLETLAPAPGAHLTLGPEYVILAPMCDVMDALTLLSVSQTVALLVSLVLFYFLAIVAPRPMARLALDDASALSIDVHSHTRFSHDGRSSFTPEANRVWHRDTGFDVAYITDHSRFAGAREAALGNPARAGDGLTALPGIEYVANHNHLLTLGASDSASAFHIPDPEGVLAARTGLSVMHPVVV